MVCDQVNVLPLAVLAAELVASKTIPVGGGGGGGGVVPDSKIDANI
jgi:hypothetical protein